MLTVGVDLAAEAAATAIAIVRWSPGRAVVTSVQVGANDEAIIDAIGGSAKVGIDCPLGWPNPFVDFITAHRYGHVDALGDQPGLERRRPLAYRTTDIATAKLVGRWPLSVSSDRIARTAMRAAVLLAKLAAQDRPVDRSGAGVVVEVYPAASLRVWGLTHRDRRRKTDVNRLSATVDRLTTAAPWLDLCSFGPLCRASDHALDSVLAALTARAAFLELTNRPTVEQLPVAQTEGWIAVPTPESLSRLVDDA